MDDFENAKIRRLRGLRPHDMYDNKIPVEKRGKMECPLCKGKGGVYFKPPAKPNTSVFLGCQTCKLSGEINADGSV